MKIDKNTLAVNTYNKIASVYTKQYFNDLSDTPYIDKLLEMLFSKAKILDIGSGAGQFSKYIYEKGFDVSGIDYSDEMIDELLLPTEKMFFNFFTKDRISKFLGKAGFTVVFQEEKPTKDPKSVESRIIYTIAKKIQK